MIFIQISKEILLLPCNGCAVGLSVTTFVWKSEIDVKQDFEYGTSLFFLLIEV